MSSRLFCSASEYNFAASSRNRPNNAARASLSAASRWARACACCVIHEVANEVRPPMAVPASAAKADMYAASIGLARCRISCGLYDELIGAKNWHSPDSRELRGYDRAFGQLGQRQIGFRRMADDRTDQLAAPSGEKL